MERETNSLLIKSNRVLGTRLVEAGLTSREDMDQANEAFIDHVRAKELRKASLLRILIFDNQTLKEGDLLDYQIEHFPVGAVMLENYHLDEVLLVQNPVDLMRVSWTLPLDYVNNRWFVATAYYMSDIVRKFWEDRLSGRVTWFITTLNELESVFEVVEEKQKSLVEQPAKSEA